jgi:hypothetical protein
MPTCFCRGTLPAIVPDVRGQWKAPEQPNPSVSPQKQKCLSPALTLMPPLLKIYISETEARSSVLVPGIFDGDFMVSSCTQYHRPLTENPQRLSLRMHKKPLVLPTRFLEGSKSEGTQVLLILFGSFVTSQRSHRNYGLYKRTFFLASLVLQGPILYITLRENGLL